MSTQNIKQRVKKLESSLQIGEKAQTLDEMFEAFERGDYGPNSMMNIVSGALSSEDPKAFYESLRKEMPGTLVDWFEERLKDHPRSEPTN